MTVYLIIHWHMVFQTSVESRSSSSSQMMRIYLVKVVGLRLTCVLHWHMAFMIFSPVCPRYFIYFFIGSRELSFFTYFIEALSPSLIAFYRSYMVPAYSVIRSALSLRLVFIKWMLIHLMRHRGYQLGGYPYRTDFDPCQGVILSELSLQIFPGFRDT